ncbi:MAG: polysaccharide deacetylase family protein [Nanobdellota archaeon]
MPIIVTVDIEEDFNDKHLFAKNLKTLVKILTESGAKATFFIVGALIHKHRDLFRKVPDQFEFGLHGYSHKNLKTIQQTDVEEEIRRGKQAIESLGKPCHGFRAPFNMVPPQLGTTLHQQGFTYDSSLCRSYYPGRYNNRSIPNKPYRAGPDLRKKGKTIIEIPITSYTFLKIPFGLTFLNNAPFLLKRHTSLSVFYFHNYDLEEYSGRTTDGTITRWLIQRRQQHSRSTLEQVLHQKTGCISCIEYIRKNEI